MMTPRRWHAALLLAALATGCLGRPVPTGPAAPAGPPWFEDVTDRVGIDFTHDAGPLDGYAMPQTVGSGCALFDYDGDGRLDVYLINNGGPAGTRNKLYHQKP